MKFEKGHRKVGGRKKGTPNKTSASIRDAILKTFDELGGAEALTTWAKKNQDEFYLRMIPRLIPMESKLDVTNQYQSADRLTDEELEQIIRNAEYAKTGKQTRQLIKGGHSGQGH